MGLIDIHDNIFVIVVIFAGSLDGFADLIHHEIHRDAPLFFRICSASKISLAMITHPLLSCLLPKGARKNILSVQ